MAAMNDGMPDRRAVRVALTAPLDGVDPLVLEPPGARAHDEPVAAELVFLDGERAVLRTAERHAPTPILLLPSSRLRGPVDGVSRREIVVDGWRIEVEVEPAARAVLRERASRGREAATHSGPTEVRAIIPGVVVAVSVAAGDQVVAGQQMVVVEAMKMQNELRASRDGTVERIAVGPGATIEVGDLLLVLS